MRFNSFGLSAIWEYHAAIYRNYKNYSFHSASLEERKWVGWSEEKCLNSDLWIRKRGADAFVGYLSAKSTTPAEWDLLLTSTLRRRTALSPRRWSVWRA